MDENKATEIAYKNGYKKGVEDTAEKILFNYNHKFTAKEIYEIMRDLGLIKGQYEKE